MNKLYFDEGFIGGGRWATDGVTDVTDVATDGVTDVTDVATDGVTDVATNELAVKSKVIGKTNNPSATSATTSAATSAPVL